MPAVRAAEREGARVRRSGAARPVTTPVKPPLPPCPHCGGELHGFGRWCQHCQRTVDTRGEKPKPAAAIPDTRSEEEIRVGIKQALRTLGWHVWDHEQQRKDPRVDAGFSDLVVIGFGVIAFAEIKSAKGAQNEAQREFERVVRANAGPGVRFCLWRSEADALSFARGVMEHTESEGVA